MKNLVSALMVTRESRSLLAANASQCFAEQTHEPRQLVVISEPHSYAPAYLAQHRIKTSMSLDPGQPLGDLRNLSLTLAAGDYVTQWDDDDLMSPRFIERRLLELQMTGADLCFLRRVVLRCMCGKEAISMVREGERDLGFWECTMLAKRQSLEDLRYPSQAKGEDFMFVKKAAVSLSIAVLDDPGLYTYRFHGENTWSAEHFDTLFSRSTAPDHKPSECLKEHQKHASP